MLNKIFSKQNRALTRELVITDFKLKYQGSVLGYVWSLLKPLLLFIILYIVFIKFLKIGNGIPHYPIYLLLGIILWNFFSDLTLQGLTSVVGRGDLIRKVKIPRWIIVFSSSISALITFMLNFTVVIAFMIFSNVSVNWNVLWLPLYLLEIYIFASGISLFLAAAYVKFRDIGYIWEVVLQAGFYLTPILYPLSKISNISFQKLIITNPVAQVVQGMRYSLITKETITSERIFNSGLYSLAPFVIVVVVFGLGAIYFKKQARYFAENI